MNYFTEGEMDFDADSANLHAALGLKTCRDVSSVCGIFDDIREHERHLHGIGITAVEPVQSLSVNDLHQSAESVDILIATIIMASSTAESISNLLSEVRKHERMIVNRSESRWAAVYRAVIFLIGMAAGTAVTLQMPGV